MPHMSMSLRTACSTLSEMLSEVPYSTGPPRKEKPSVVGRLAHLLAEAGHIVGRAAVLCDAAPRGLLQVGGVEGPEEHVIGQQTQQVRGHVGWHAVTRVCRQRQEQGVKGSRRKLGETLCLHTGVPGRLSGPACTGRNRASRALTVGLQKQPGDQMTKGGVHRGLAMALDDAAVDECGDPRAAALQL